MAGSQWGRRKLKRDMSWTVKMPSTHGGEWAEKPLRGQQAWTAEKYRGFDRQSTCRQAGTSSE
jgi:hypothetical protein